ncbi:MAG: hypothetical protein RLZZ15_2027, partial [Verrucomicrobiota bacterium]
RPSIGSVAGDTGVLDFAYTTNVPAGSASFTVQVSYPAGLTGTQTISASAVYRSPLVQLAIPNIALGVGVIVVTPIPPVITTQPTGRTVDVGQSVTLTVAASGSPTPTFQWLRNSVTLVGATQASLTFANVQSTDAGTYLVVASNSGGSVLSSPAVLTVNAPPGIAPPFITSPPAGQSVFSGADVALSVSATSTVAATYQWRKDGIAIAGATSSTLTLNAVGLAAAGVYTVTVTNSAGSTTSPDATLTVTTRPLAGTYFGTFAGAAGTFALYVRADHTGVFLAYTRAAKLALVSREVRIDPTGRFSFATSPATLTTPTLAAAPALGATATPAAAETPYTIVGAIAADGTVSGTLVGLNLAFAAPAPAPGATSALAGYYPTGAAGSSATAHAILGAAGEAYVLSIVAADADAATGTLAATGSLTFASKSENNAFLLGAVLSGTLSLTVVPAGGAALTYVGANPDRRPDTERLLNVSTRSQTTAGAGALIAGFVITGTQPKLVLLRGIGPSLAPFGVTGALPAARLELFRGPASLAVGLDWGTVADAPTIAAAAARVGAFPLAPTSRDAALLVSLEPGAYTAILTGQDGATGVCLVEAYDATTAPVAAGPRLINLASRAAVGTGESTLIGGFVVTGTVPKRVLLRGIGPALAQFGLTGTLARPQLLLLKGSQTLQQNTGWSTSPDAAAIAATAVQVGAFTLAPGSADSALLIYLDPGAYTAQVVGAANATGLALVEIYEVP